MTQVTVLTGARRRRDWSDDVICAFGRDGEDYVFTPFGHLAEGNPFDAYLPPEPSQPVG